MTSYVRPYTWEQAKFTWNDARAQKTWATSFRTGTVVLSDVKIRAGDVTEVDFVEMLANDSAAAYEDFRLFVPGDYTYKDALYKISARTTGNDQPRLNNLSVSLDVPDVFEVGIADVIPSGTRVYFNKSYLVPPTVTAILKGGSAYGVPKVTSVTRTYFDVIVMEDAISNVEATISWNAVGY